ncbi:ATP-binding protein [Methylobacter sp.]|uniref:ATP-binding protein n=1 Tax=Methylobacter sp. TaxID=2051955 RepID=UPI0024892415|nr:ATP-binding protein [Methylobacter sp.]MDI1278171.1 ATP-binding protein [Methylobacter sp.]MDI1358914.1 ATP-binding protein [Methylobacter sp.]
MKLQIERKYVEAMVNEFPGLAALNDQLRFGNKAEVSFKQLSNTELSFLQSLYKNAGTEMQGHVALLSTLQKAMNDDTVKFEEHDLEMLLPAIARYLINDAIRGWLFQTNVAGKPMAYVVTRLDFTPSGEEETGRVTLELKANAKGKVATSTVTIRARDIADKTVTEIFVAKGFLKETPELIATYDDAAGRYFEWCGQSGTQFLGKGTGFYAEDPTASHRSTDWARKDVVVLSTEGGTARLVNDESILSERALSVDAKGDILAKYLRKAAKSNRYDLKIENEVEASEKEIPKGLFTELPVHCYLLMFHLELHHHLWVHVNDIKPYRYQPELKQKLILREEQIDLIDILTAEMDVLMDDIIEGKSGGTTVLCAGPAGVGKTLTAEVYSEIIKRPLYRVHSGQLGLNVGEMEKALKDVLTRAQRWGAVMLIDEADVYIKRRDNNIAMNAVVGVFLRVLEYFNGLLFLTTNRVDDIDEAIVSRCIALIKYYPPDSDARRRIWQVMIDQFELDVDDDLIDQLVDSFPEATGRDIKGLSKLVAKFCQHKKVTPTLDVFKRCSIFRGMVMEKSVENALNQGS